MGKYRRFGDIIVGKLYRRSGDENKFLISHSVDNIPISFTDINDWLAAKHLFPDYIAEPPLDFHDGYTICDLEFSVTHFIQQQVDFIILRDKLSSLVPKDNTEVISSFMIANADLVKQYTPGNQKILNSLVGKFLKENKGYVPQEVKTKIENILNEK